MGKGESVAELVTTKEIWRRSSYSANGGACLEVCCSNNVLVRDSRQSGTVMLAFSAAAWKELLSGVHRR